MINISVVTFNRREMLQRVLEAIVQTCPEEHRVYVTDNASSDDTGGWLMEEEAKGKLRAWLLPENLGTSGGRNAHWRECADGDAVRMDDKVLPLARGWLSVLQEQSRQHHAIVAVPYDPSVLWLWRLAPIADFVVWESEGGAGGPLIYIPQGVIQALGGVDELGDCKYGWDDCLFIERAKLLGWKFGFSLRCPCQFLAQASPERRAKAMEYHPRYMERLKEYQEAQRDLFIPFEETNGYKVILKEMATA